MVAYNNVEVGRIWRKRLVRCFHLAAWQKQWEDIACGKLPGNGCLGGDGCSIETGDWDE